MHNKANKLFGLPKCSSDHSHCDSQAPDYICWQPHIHPFPKALLEPLHPSVSQAMYILLIKQFGHCSLVLKQGGNSII